MMHYMVPAKSGQVLTKDFFDGIAARYGFKKKYKARACPDSSGFIKGAFYGQRRFSDSR